MTCYKEFGVVCKSSSSTYYYIIAIKNYSLWCLSNVRNSIIFNIDWFDRLFLYTNYINRKIN